MMPEPIEAIERSTMRRVYWRLIPLLFFAMFFNYLDRINIGFAGLRMNHDLGFSPGVFGFAGSIFFLGYMLLGIPSNLALSKFGARHWIPVILITWGAIAILTGFVWNSHSFYAVRLCLGIAEAGFLPGLALYSTFWFPAAYRARAIGGYIIAGQFSAVVGGPLSTALMTYCDHVFGLHGWQWMFIFEGAPTILLGLSFLVLLTSRPAQAGWLRPEQRAWLETTLERERLAADQSGHPRIRDAFLDGRVWSLAILFGCALVGVYGMLIWLPQIINAMGHLTLIQVGMLAAVPPGLGVLGTLIVSYSSDRTGDRKKHLAGVYILAGVALSLSAISPNIVVAYILLCVAGFGLNSGNPLFWSLGASMMTGRAGAVAIALANTIAQFGGLIGPWMIGLVKGSTGSFADALLAIAAFLFAAAAIALALRVAPRPVSLAGLTSGPNRQAGS
jgi:ACS family tartrate transporter-like MFS transporter